MSELSAQHLRGPPARRHDLMPVEDLPGYRVDREIGQGGMGRVYVARDLALGREVAVKGLHRDWDDDNQARERLRREARLLARLRHPNIVQVYDLLVVGRDLWIVMEFVPGLSLTRCGPWKPEQVVCLVCQLASALAYAHASHIVHLDLKPSNVLTSENGTSRLLRTSALPASWHGRPRLAPARSSTARPRTSYRNGAMATRRRWMDAPTSTAWRS